MSKCSPPVFYYHSVAPAKNDSWVLNGLTFSLQKFEDQLQYLAKNGFRSIFLDEYSDIREGKKSSNGNEICLTFDDGYLDNWVYVWPLAKKYGIRFTLFASPECLDPRSIVRPNLADVWAGTCTMNELDDRGYLTWDELRAMQESGIVDVQSHTMSHTKYITSDEVTGFYYGGPRGVYPIWNQNPGLKPVYMADPGFENRLPWGYPLFKEQSAVIAHKATINPEIFLELSALGAGYDLSEAAQRPVYEADALQVLKSHRANNTLITERELQTDYLQRLHYEVVKSKEVLEQRLEKPIHFLCWPHGDNTQEAHELARSSGYRATTSGKLTGESGKVDRIPRLGGDFDNAPWLSRQKFHFKINSHYQRQPYRAVREIYDLKTGFCTESDPDKIQMFFFLKRIYQSSKSLQVKQCATALPEVVEENILYLVAGKQSCSSVEVPAKGVFWILGDPIGALSSPENLIKANGDIDLHTLYTELAGHYNWFWVGRDRLATGSSFGGILPVYYHHEINCVCISSSSDFLADRIHAPANDRRYILERLLFHYPLFDATWYQEIKLLPAHSQLSITATHFSVRKNLDFSAYSGTPSKSHNRDLNQLAEQFVSACSDFMPVNRFGISLTGGFDGRTLVGVALKNNRSFFTYSFGAACSSDIQVPARQAKKLGLSHHSIILDENYLRNDADRSIQDFMSLSDYHGNVGRPHYLYSASILSQETSFIVTGNFGSELFRALHLPGMMMTKHLIDVFSSSDRQWKDRLWTEVKSWGQNDFDAELEGLIDDINKYLDESGMTGNARFYRFVYEELFRKYFGPEIIMQNHFLNNRTPYLNYSFVHSLNQTIWSGVHRPLFEENKFKRMIGQLFYAQVLRMSDHRLYRMKTSKGYAPNDVGESWRKPVLFYRYIQQKFNQNEALDDNNVFSVIEHFMQESKLNGIPDSGITFKGLNRDTLINWLSIAYGITKRNANHYASTTY